LPKATSNISDDVATTKPNDQFTTPMKNMRVVRTLALLVLIPMAPLHAADRPPIKPSILHIRADDHRADGLHALGNPMDLFPTFAEFAGAKVPAGAEGQSIVPILNNLAGKQTKVRDVFDSAYRNCQRAIRDERWKLIRYPLVNRTQLFDLSVNPDELNNLADKLEHKAKLEMTALLRTEMG
jgi:arylsulfatase A-like enzyme